MRLHDSWGSAMAARIEAEEREHARRHICTPEDPWTPEKGRCTHPAAREVPGSQRDGWPAGDIIDVHCPICAHTWEEELPQ